MKPTKDIQTPRKVASVVARNAQTQTVGLFYPGGKRVDTESHQALDQLVRQSTAVSLAKTVSATSPGNGKWKDQLDHINHHLKGKEYFQTKKFYKILISICSIEFGISRHVRRASSWSD